MKGFETMAVSESDVPGVADWYDDMANDILAQQVTTAGPSFGSWPSSPAYVWPDGTLGHMVHPALSTVWALLTLERFAPPPPVIEVSLDIHPTSCPNPFNVNGKGVIPVAILGTEDFDVTMIDPASLLLEGIAPLRWAMEDVATPYGEFSDPPGCMECTEEGRDGYMDLTVKFKMQEVAAAISGVEDGDCIVLNITGNLKEDFGGTEIVGSDVVRIIKKK